MPPHWKTKEIKTSKDVVLLLTLFVSNTDDIFSNTEPDLHVFSSLDELVRSFQKPTMEGKSLVSVVAVELMYWSHSV